MESGTYEHVVWEENPNGIGRNSEEENDGDHSSNIILQDNDDEDDEVEYLVGEEIITSSDNLDRIPQENLIYMTADGNSGVGMSDLIQEQVDQAEQMIVGDQEFMECEVTEEIITDDWVQQQGEECVEVSVDQLCAGGNVIDGDHEEVPLPTDQDEYTSSRPYPCDFCSRRFRKKANLMNHMIAHQNDRPHVCNLCGSKYIRRCDLLNHFKIHAYVPEDDDNSVIIHEEDEFTEDNIDEEFDNANMTPKYKRRQHKNSTTSLDDAYELLLSSPIANSITQSTISTEIIVPTTSRKRNKSSSYSGRGRGGKGRLIGKTDRRSNKGDPLAFANEDFRTNSQGKLPRTERYPITDSRKPFVCQHCGVSFAREKALASHARMHGGDSPFECETCGEMFWDIISLQDHISLRHSDQPASNSEYEPDENFDNLANDDDDDSADSDFDILNNSKMGQFYCSHCGMSFTRNEALKRHIKIEHIKNERYDNYDDQNNDRTENDDDEDNDDCRHCCNVCGDKFAEALDLLAHAEIHARFEPYKCLLCGEAFVEESSIKNHITARHAIELTENSCRLCGKLCRDGRALMKHSWDHSREKNHSCSKCGKTFHNKARLKRHMQSHRNKSVQCEICNEKFPDGRSLMNHRHSHTKSSQFPCHECGKSFGSRSSQQIHLRIHTGERPYGCRFCWKAFADGGTLRKHERIHTGEKPYVCSICPRAFNQRVVLREHIRSHHSAPDSKRGNSLAPYYCSVCTQLFSSSALLIQHLIQHSDVNTALKRQPLSGPRKYKRRRKLKPHELDRSMVLASPTSPKSDKDVESDDSDSNRYRTNDMSFKGKTSMNDTSNTTKNKKRNTKANNKRNDIDTFDIAYNNKQHYADNDNVSDEKDDDVDDEILEKIIKQENSDFDKYNELQFASSKSKRTSTVIGHESNLQISRIEDSLKQSEDNNILVSNTRKHSLNIPSTGTATRNSRSVRSNAASSTVQRPKMIHTQKTRVPMVDGKRKTKTYITKEVKQDFAGSHSGSTNERRARTKNVNNYITPLVGKVQPATFPLIDDNNSSERDNETAIMTSRHHFDNPQLPDDDNLLLEISQKDKYYDRYNSDIVHDLEEILRSPIKSINNNNSSMFSDGDTGSNNANSPTTSYSSLLTTRRSKRTPKPIFQQDEFSKTSNSSMGISTKSSSNRKTSEKRRSAAGTARTTIISPSLLKKNSPRKKTATRQTNFDNSPNVVLASDGRSTRSSTNFLNINIKKEKAPEILDDVNQFLVQDKNYLINIKSEIDLDDDDNQNEDDDFEITSETEENITNSNDDDGSEKVFRCEMCSMTFKDRVQLVQHVPSHILEYACS